MDVKDKRVMDAGCGTAILAIVASKLGAREVEAFDIDDWSVENGNENIAVNSCENIRIQQGSIDEIDLSGSFHVILSNINKNVLLDDIKAYRNYLVPGGLLLLSGFFALDIPDLLAEGVRHGFKEVLRDERDTWAALLLMC
jgi:ribosomal protein L11 methyltransferase